MGEDKKQDFKKNFSNSFIWFLLAAFLFALMVQNFIETKFAKVSFSYQLEHLVNLQLIQPEDSRKTALNDNLVTFSGKFRDRLTEEGKNRYKFLELLHENHALLSDKERLSKEITSMRSKITNAGEWFLLLSGLPVPEGGYVIVEDLYNSSDKDNSVIITQLPKKNVVNLADLNRAFNSLGNDPAAIQSFGKSLSTLIGNFRSPMLGIGNESIKTALRNIDKNVIDANEGTLPFPQKMAIYGRSRFCRYCEGLF
jgi:cell division protease FtsH